MGHIGRGRRLVVGGLLAVGCWMVAAAVPAMGQSVRGYLSADSIRVGDRFTLTLVAEHNLPSAPLFPGPEAGEEFFGDLEMLGVRSQGGAAAGGLRVDSLVYDVTTFAIDTAYVPSIPVFFVAGADTTFFATYPIELPIISLVPGDAEDIRDLAPLADFPINPWPWILGFLLLGALLGLGYRYWKRRPPPADSEVIEVPVRVIPPYEEAVARFRALEKTARLDDIMQVKPYYVELTETLRVYLSRRLRIHAMENTSYELMKDLNDLALKKTITPEAVYLTKRVLHVSDLVKFADMRPKPEVGHQALVEARKILDTIEEALSPSVQAPPVESVAASEEVGE